MDLDRSSERSSGSFVPIYHILCRSWRLNIKVFFLFCNNLYFNGVMLQQLRNSRQHCLDNLKVEHSIKEHRRHAHLRTSSLSGWDLRRGQTVWMLHKHRAADMFVCFEPKWGVVVCSRQHRNIVFFPTTHVKQPRLHSCSGASAKSCCTVAFTSSNGS